MQPFSGNLRLDLLTHLTHVSLVLRLPCEMHLSKSSSNVPRLPWFLKTATKPSRFAYYSQGAQSPAPATQKRHLSVQQCSVPPQFFALLTWKWKCTSCHKEVQLFRHRNFQEWADTMHFDLEMCFAPQRRALFRHRNFQKWSEAKVFCTFWLRNVLRATTVCTFSYLIWPHGSAPAALASLLFDPPEHKSWEKMQGIATFLPFRAPASYVFWLFLFSDLLFFFSSLLWLLPPLLVHPVHIVGRIDF